MNPNLSFPTTPDCLIGHTGFVGSNLARQHNFEATYNSRTIDAAKGMQFDKVVCAAAPGSMFEANRMPERDRERMDGLIGQLDGIGARRMILVSTIAVLDGFAAQDEANCTFEDSTPYGVNRRRLEDFVLDRFPGSLVVRLPALFGPGLKKNFLFDLSNPVPSMLTRDKIEQLKADLPSALSPLLDQIFEHDESVSMYVLDRDRLMETGKREQIEEALAGHGMTSLQFTNPESTFQFYDMSGLWADIERALDAGLRVLHLAPHPLKAGDIFTALTGRVLPPNGARVHSEDMGTAHAGLWNRDGRYITGKSETLDGIVRFFADGVTA